MSELLKKQNYGVEVEFTGISRKMAADAVAEIIGTTASRPDHTCYQTRTIRDSQGRKWKVMRDSSINPIRKVGTENMDEYRVEFVTPVGMTGSKFVKKEVCPDSMLQPGTV